MKIQIFLATALAIQCSQCEVTEVVVESGSAAVLPCFVSSPSIYSTAVHWKRVAGGVQRTVWRRDKSGLEFRSVGGTLRVQSLQPNFGKGNYSLHIQGVRAEDAGLYHCEVEGNRLTYQQVILRVITVSFTPAKVTEGENMQMTCNITSQPLKRITVEWYLNGSLMRSASISQTHSLYHVSQSEAGNWTCLIKYKQTWAKASAFLQVKGVVFPKESSAVVYGEVGSSVTLPCVFSDGLFADRASWERVSGFPASLPLTFRSAVECGPLQCDHSAVISSVQEVDEGMYRCSGQMEGADGRRVTVDRHIQLITARALKSSQSGSVTLTCHLGNASQATNYEWLKSTYNGNATTLAQVQKSKSNMLRIPNTEVKDLGEWICRFYEHQRLLGNVTFHMQTMSGLAGDKQPVSSNRVAVLVGLGLLVLLVLLILFQMYKNHRRRKMIMQYPAMETIVHQAATEREKRERHEGRDKYPSTACHGDVKQEAV